MNLNQNIITDFVDFRSEGSIGAFIDFIDEGEVVKSVDLLEANPDVAEQVTRGQYIVNIVKLAEAASTYVVVIDNGEPFDFSEAWLDSFVFVTNNLDSAQDVFNETLMTWKRIWGLTL